MTQRRKPDGTHTSDTDEWAKAWDEFNGKLERVLNVKVVGFDPGIQVTDENFQGATTLPMWLAKRIVKLA